MVCNNSLALEGSLFAQGGVALSNSCSVNEDVYAKNAITMSNSSRIGHDAKSSRDSISLANNAQIDNNATAYSTITLSGSARVNGTRTQNYTTLADPPAKPLPAINYDATGWSTTGDVIEPYSSCDAARSRLPGGLPDDGRNYVIRITDSCLLSWSNNSSITVRQDVAIIFDGRVSFENRSNWYSGDGEEHSILFINPASTSASCSSRNPAFSTSNNTSFADELKVFVYTPCGARFNNSNTINGQLMAGLVNVQNSFDLYFSPIPVPGFGDVAGFDQDIAFQREVAP